MARRGRMLVAGVALLVSLAALGVVFSALRRGHRSSGDYAAFAACPLGDPETTLCLFSRTEGGEFVAGSKTVPISKAITLQGGVHVVENAEREIVRDEFIGAKGGETLSRTPQPVPRGLRGVVDPELLGPALRNAYDKLIDEGVTEATATIELAAPASSIGIDVQKLIEARGTALVLPVKIKLSNAFLGESCYMGSNARPIVIALTTGRLASTRRARLHRSIGGKAGHAEFKDHYNLVTLSEDSLVNDTFAAPAARGCGGTRSFAVDRAVDAELGLPAAAGRNTAILDGTLRDANAPAVRAGSP